MINIIGLGGAGCTSCEYISAVFNSKAQFFGIDKDDPEGLKFAVSEFVSGEWQLKRHLSNAYQNLSLKLTEAGINSTKQIYLVGLGGKVGTELFLQIIQNETPDGAVFVCFLPFNFEGKQRMQTAIKASEIARNMQADVLLYPNQDLFSGAHPKETFTEAFRRRAKRLITDIPIK